MKETGCFQISYGNFLHVECSAFRRMCRLASGELFLGRTVPTYRLQLEKERRRWGLFRTALRADEQPAFDNLFIYARTYADAASAVARPCPSEAIFMSMILGLYQEVQRLRLALATAARNTRPFVNQNYHENVRRVQAEM